MFKYHLQKILRLATAGNITKVVLAVIAAISISYLKLDYLESYTYDTRIYIKALLGLSKIKNPDVSLIIVDTQTVEFFKGYPTFNDHSDFLQKLYALHPSYVIYDFRAEKGELLDFDGSYEAKKHFASVADSFKNFYVATNDLELKGSVSRLKLKEPLDALNFSSCPKTSDINLYARDGVSRRLMISYQDQPMLQAVIAGDYNSKIKNLDKIKGTFDVFDSKQAYINYHPPGSFPHFKFEDIIKGNVPEKYIQGKIIIVGLDTGRSSKDYSLTPYSREVTAMTSPELHANIFQTLIDNNAPVKVPEPVNIAVTFLISILTVYVVIALKPSHGLWILGATLLSISLVGTLLLALFNVWIDLAHPYLAIFLCYYFFIPYRLIIENRRSWEYIQKNKLLHQVEELKTNFISMMSHDLKTPIARIQGMTEVILKDNVTLSTSQREAVDTIKGSSDDLLKFINSILQYGRIESQGIELHKHSKDINQLMQDVIKKHEFLAKVKKIRVKTELEPMFPVKVDPELIKQVFSNLVENAIKYSPEDSEVYVRTREEAGQVIIEVVDQGMGIPAEDLPNIFMKFYRSQNVKTSTIKGTGLGLYLAKYFIELHKGELSVVSEPQKGSVFKIVLPEDA